MRPHLLHHHHRSMHPHAPRVLLGIGMIAIFVIALMLVFADTAGAAPRPGHGLELGPLGAGRHTHGMLPGLGLGILDAAEKLNLQDDQVTRLREIRKNAPAQLMPKAQALMEARIEFQDLMHQENASPDALRRANQRLQDARSAMQAAAFDLRLQIREVLTPKQRAELKDIVRERARERGAAGPGDRGMRRPPRGGWDLENDLEF